MTRAEQADAHKPRVLVLLATFNGRQWIEPQVQSILAQTGVDVRLVVSDDNSTDGTWEWLTALAESHGEVTLLPRGTRFGGAARNFFRLIRDADLAQGDFVALADQDDIWLPGKLVRAVEMIGRTGAAAYSGNVTAFWPDGRSALIDKAQEQRRFDYMFEAAGPGCTYVLRSTAMQQFRQFLLTHWEPANEAALHDWLMYAWCRANGLKWFIDGEPMLQYRQHGNNQFGANHGMAAVRSRLRMMRSGWYRREIRRIAALVDATRVGAPRSLASDGTVPRLFLLRHWRELRRRTRDQLFFFVTVMFGIY